MKSFQWYKTTQINANLGNKVKFNRRKVLVNIYLFLFLQLLFELLIFLW